MKFVARAEGNSLYSTLSKRYLRSATPAPGTSASLVLFTLDGTVGSSQPPEAALSIKFYNDDEVQFSSSCYTT